MQNRFYCGGYFYPQEERMNNDRDNLQKQREDLEKEEEELLAEVMKLRSYFVRKTKPKLLHLRLA